MFKKLNSTFLSGDKSKAGFPNKGKAKQSSSSSSSQRINRKFQKESNQNLPSDEQLKEDFESTKLNFVKQEHLNNSLDWLTNLAFKESETILSVDFSQGFESSIQQIESLGSREKLYYFDLLIHKSADSDKPKAKQYRNNFLEKYLPLFSISNKKSAFHNFIKEFKLIVIDKSNENDEKLQNIFIIADNISKIKVPSEKIPLLNDIKKAIKIYLNSIKNKKVDLAWFNELQLLLNNKQVKLSIDLDDIIYGVSNFGNITDELEQINCIDDLKLKIETYLQDSELKNSMLSSTYQKLEDTKQEILVDLSLEQLNSYKNKS